VNKNQDERNSRKGAKAQRKAAKINKHSNSLRLLCVFAPLRETFLSAYETESLLTANCSFLLPAAWIKSNGIRSFPEGNTVCGYFPAREIIYDVLAEHFRAWRV
jgi:hypothetical protein